MRSISLLIAFSLLGCRAGTVAEQVQPELTDAGQAMNEHQCEAVPERGTPLIVDWGSHQKADLEEIMRGGLAVVAYDCEKLELLADCQVQGSYGWMGSELKQDMVSLAGLGEIAANLPTSKVTLQGEVTRESVLDLGLVQVGKFRSAVRSASRAALLGEPDECARATHYVRGAYVGAFALRNDTLGRVATAAELFKFSAGAKSEASRAVVRTDGDPSRCSSGDPFSDRPPAGCAGILRLELKAIGEGSDTLASDDVDFSDCPAGLVEVGGKCTLAGVATTHVCASTDAVDCQAQCDAGEPASCGRLAFMYHYGRHGLETNLELAAAAYTRACEGGDQFGCAGLGYFLDRGIGGLAKDSKRAEQLQQSACSAGEARGCNNLAFMRNHAGDHEVAFALYERACAGGWTQACTNLGTFYEAGLVVERSFEEANRRYQLGCDLGDGSGCMNIGDALWRGRGVATNHQRAMEMFEQGCTLGSPRACLLLGSHALSGPPKPRITAERICKHLLELDQQQAPQFWGVKAVAGQRSVPNAVLMEVAGLLIEHAPDGDGATVAPEYVELCHTSLKRQAKQRGAMWDPVAACLLDAWTDEALEKCERRYIAGDSQWSHERWNKQLAANAFRRGCALGEATACEVLSQALAANFFEAQDGETQQTLHQRACELSPTCGVETSALEDEGGLTNPSH